MATSERTYLDLVKACDKSVQPSRIVEFPVLTR